MIQKRRTKTAFVTASLLWVLIIPLLHTEGSTATRHPEVLDPLEQGKQLFSQGKFKEALNIWQSVAGPVHVGQSPTSEQTRFTLLQAEGYRKLGQYQHAATLFNQALQWGKQEGNSLVVSQALNHLGAMAFEVGESEKALELLQEGLEVAKSAGHSAIVAGLLNSLGNVFINLDRNNEALGAYTESAGLAGLTNNQELELIALINSARAAKQDGFLENSEDRLDLAMERTNALADGHSKVSTLLTLGLLYADLRAPKEVLTNRFSPGTSPSQSNTRGAKRGVEIGPGSAPPELKEMIVVPEPDITIPPFTRTEQTQGKSLIMKAYQALQEARVVAHQIGDTRGSSHANGYLGHLYEENEQYDEALFLTRQAVLIGQQSMATDLLYQWHWQIARIQNNQGHGDEAKQAYGHAIAALGTIRNEVSAAYQGRKQPFREGVGAMYFELADLLLLKTKDSLNADEKASLLVEARNTIEAFKAAELQDYFQEDCVQPSQSLNQTLQTASPNTAVLYPILLQDRTEIIVNFPSGLKRYTVPVPEKELTEQARQFRLFVQQPENLEHQKSSRKLYSWLMQPLEQDLQAEGIQTLVMVPDGALRSIPISALHDGTRFLIEKYAIATTPGLTLTDPKPLARDNIKVLSMGITQAVQGFPALPYVEKELETITAMYGGMKLMNENFVVRKMESQLKIEDYNVVHIASHGLVGSDVKNTFVLAFDEKITMDRLAELVGLFRFRKAPLELLTLSACETAAGDDRAALGLAGVAVKAGARSALATLWFIDDAVTSDLIGEFYQQLQNPAMSKAQALQKAQVKILKDPQFHHPNFWSPFLLINNWL